jgi:hypothetical protein
MVSAFTGPGSDVRAFVLFKLEMKDLTCDIIVPA